MDDPFSALMKCLRSLFDSEPIRNNKYTFPPVQDLKQATEEYRSDDEVAFICLLKAIGNCRPYIEKWRVDFDEIKACMEQLSKTHSWKRIDWDRVDSNQSYSLKFQFETPNNESLIDWLSEKKGVSFEQLNEIKQTQVLLDFRDHNGFSQKLSAYLNENPDFLFNLIQNSSLNFLKICHTRLNLYLTDQQIAQAIVAHTPKLVQENPDPFKQVELLVDKLNEVLSHGRSVTTLLRNKEAKVILDQCSFLNIYQSDEFKNRDQEQNTFMSNRLSPGG